MEPEYEWFKTYCFWNVNYVIKQLNFSLSQILDLLSLGYAFEPILKYAAYGKDPKDGYATIQIYFYFLAANLITELTGTEQFLFCDLGVRPGRTFPSHLFHVIGFVPVQLFHVVYLHVDVNIPIYQQNPSSVRHPDEKVLNQST